MMMLLIAVPQISISFPHFQLHIFPALPPKRAFGLVAHFVSPSKVDVSINWKCFPKYCGAACRWCVGRTRSKYMLVKVFVWTRVISRSIYLVVGFVRFFFHSSIARLCQHQTLCLEGELELVLMWCPQKYILPLFVAPAAKNEMWGKIERDDVLPIISISFDNIFIVNCLRSWGSIQPHDIRSVYERICFVNHVGKRHFMFISQPNARRL